MAGGRLYRPLLQIRCDAIALWEINHPWPLNSHIKSKNNGSYLNVHFRGGGSVLLCPDEEVELLYQRHYQGNGYAQKDENTDRTEYAIAALGCALETFSIYKQTPSEFLAANAKEILAQELRELLSNTRPDVKEWSPKTLLRALGAIESYVEQYPRQPGSGRVIVDTIRFIKDYVPSKSRGQT